MGCKNCRDFNDNSCTDIISSSCVKWQGNAHEELDICLDDSLTYVINIVLDKIKDLLKGKGVVLEDLTLSDCVFINSLLGVEEKNLLNVLDVYKQAICQLKTATDLNAANLLAFTNVTLYTLGCLPPLDPCGEPYDFKTLIQAIITKLCTLSAQFDSIASTILDVIEEGAGNFLLGGAVTSCGGNGFTTSGTGATAVIKFEALVPPYSPILYTGSLALFDGTGIGLPGTAMCGWYLCNGSNGTPNSSSLPQNLAANLKYIIRFT